MMVCVVDSGFAWFRWFWSDTFYTGMYYTAINVGGQKVDLQVDTGSSVMALPRKDCQNCKRGDHRYDPSLSGTSREVLCHDDDCDGSQYGACSGNYCHFSLTYADGSGASGVLMCDKVDWGERLSPVEPF